MKVFMNPVNSRCENLTFYESDNFTLTMKEFVQFCSNDLIDFLTAFLTFVRFILTEDFLFEMRTI